MADIPETWSIEHVWKLPLKILHSRSLSLSSIHTSDPKTIILMHPYHHLSRYLWSKSDDFSNKILLHTLMTSFSTLSWFFDSPEWTALSAACPETLGRLYVHRSRWYGAYICANHTDFESFCDPPNTVNVLREEVSSETDFGIVCEFLLDQSLSRLQ